MESLRSSRWWLNWVPSIHAPDLDFLLCCSSPSPALLITVMSSPQPPSLVYFCLSASEKSCHLLLLSNRKKIKVTTNIPLLITLQTLNSDYKTRKPSGGRSSRQRVKKGHIKEQWLAVHQVNLKRCSASSMSAGQMEGEQRSSWISMISLIRELSFL